MRNTLLAALLIALGGLGFGCDAGRDGPLERGGEEVDESVDEGAEKLDEGVDDLDRKVND
ncbi:MAG: hypothetical protein AB1540_05230 [Bdellovibrionota bacterium]